MPVEKMFEDQLWHPGYQEQSNMSCVIHAINLFCGGALYTTREMLIKIYCSRRKKQYERIAEESRLHGLNLVNLRRIIFVPSIN